MSIIEVLKNIFLILSVIVVFISGYFIMTILDKFLNENCKIIEKLNQKKEPFCVMLTEQLSDEEIAEEVRRFRSKHKNIRIILYDSSNTKFSEDIEYHTRHKQ